MRSSLTLTPDAYAIKKLLVHFHGGKPLSSEQYNFLRRHEKALSSSQFDPVIKYYLERHRDQDAHDASFLLPSEQVNRSAIARLKKRLAIMLAEQKNITISLTPPQFIKYQRITQQELILYHGNQFLTGAPFYPGGIPQVIFFQWGNLFGVAKYVVRAEEKSLTNNVLIYFENRMERELSRCVADYQKRTMPHYPMQDAYSELKPLKASAHKFRYTANPF